MRFLFLLLLLVACAPGPGGFSLSVDGEPLLSDKDIISYNWTSHEMTVTPEAAARIRDSTIDAATGLAGRGFELRIDGEIIYTGAMWSRVLSRTYEGIVINDVLIFNQTLEIDPWYPDFQARGPDRRDDPRVREHFAVQGKITY